MSGQGLTVGTSYSTQAYLYVTGSGLQVSKRYNRSPESFADGLTAQSHTANTAGAISRWDFWELTSQADRSLSVRVKVNGSNRVTRAVSQVATGSFGYLTVESSQGYSDGLHAALFTKDGAPEAYANQVAAQSGMALTAEQDALLQSLATRLRCRSRPRRRTP